MVKIEKKEGTPVMTYRKALVGFLIPLVVLMPMVVLGVDLLMAYLTTALFHHLFLPTSLPIYTKIIPAIDMIRKIICIVCKLIFKKQ